MQKFSGSGIALAEFDGSVTEYDLEPGESIILDTGHLAALDATCTMDISRVKGVKNVLFGGEGLFNTIVTGPGHVWIQSMPLVNLAGIIASQIPSKGF